jgi:cell division protein FtsB
MEEMKKLGLVYKKITIFSLLIGITYLAFNISLTGLETVRQEKIEKEQYVFSLQQQVDQLNKEIGDLEDPEMIEKVLRREGYGKEGEIIYIMKVPEPVAPLSEIFNQEQRKSMIEKFIDFITGRN